MICRLLIVLGAVLISGCSSYPQYPVTWNAIPANAHCPNIDGVYSNFGQIDKDIRGAYLISLLIDGMLTNYKDVDTVKIETTSNDITFEAYENNNLVKRIIAKYEYSKCENGMLNIDQQEPEGFVAREGVVGYTWQSLWVTKDEFGSLIIRSDSGAVGIMLFIPVIGSEWNWYRFMNKNI